MELVQSRNPHWFYKVLHSPIAGMVALVVLALLGLYCFWWRDMRFFLVPSQSMEPTLFPNDMIITVNQRDYQRGDIVVWQENGEYVVKRIVGVPGDYISVADGALFINGKYASEPYIKEAMTYRIETPVKIPEGFFFYLGDNRNMSDDSSMGFSSGHTEGILSDVKAFLGEKKAIIGKVVFRYYPYNRFGVIRSYPLTNTAGQ